MIGVSFATPAVAMNQPHQPHDLSPPPWHATGVLPALVAGACLSRALLTEFEAGMRQLGLPVQVPRMRYDRIYARQVITLAHGLGDDALRLLALQLFEHYQRGPRP